MKISVHSMTEGSFAPMLRSLSEVLDKGAAHAVDAGLDLVNARLAPDMFTLAQQVQQACHYARDGVARLTGQPSTAMPDAETTLVGLKAQIIRTIEVVRAAPAAAFDGAEDRDCSIAIGEDLVIEMDGARFLTGWSLPHFYFHVVTAYDILRHCGVAIGKNDYLSQVGGFIRKKTA
jgi:uncharacterized protein